ncbi:MAG: hypothetical protein P4K94_09460 [Terracidiphilus sp.]|nr:hypothetical protein [Terracidiphilus sp.]
MKRFQSVLMLIAGMLCGIAIQRYVPVRPVHAEDELSSGATCIAEVPKSWGEYKGASEYGLAFEDQNGTLRFLLHPPCGMMHSSNTIPNPAIDLRLDRK